MKNSRFYRLLLGIIILFSIFLFQGTKAGDSCSSEDEACFDELADSKFAYLEIYNYTGGHLVVVVCEKGAKKDEAEWYKFKLEKGEYGKRVTIKEGTWETMGGVYILPQPVPVRYTNKGFFKLKAGETGVYNVY